jgi:uroporphyrinogen-III synthase|tara:strand:+ start:256 stop:981 length:726 start_codon:yes stop_codon:yes gene_type:complete
VKILLTRPINDSIKTADILRQSNIKSVILPFLEIKKYKQNIQQFLSDDILMFTSKNGAKLFRCQDNIKKNLAFAVGNETKKKLQQKGFKNIINVDGDLEKLLKVIKDCLKAGQKIYHPTSNKENQVLKNFFFNLGCNYYAIKCYTSKMIGADKKKLEFFMKEKKNLITFFSPLTARSFAKQVIENELKNLCLDNFFLVISNKVKKELNNLGKLKIFIPNEPKQSKMIDLIKKISLEKIVGQ